MMAGQSPMTGIRENMAAPRRQSIVRRPIRIALLDTSRIPRYYRLSKPASRRTCIMHNHDLISDGFLTLTGASLVLLGSILLALTFG